MVGGDGSVWLAVCCWFVDWLVGVVLLGFWGLWEGWGWFSLVLGLTVGVTVGFVCF